MKLLKYMIAVLLLGTVSCAEDETNDSVLAGQREALLAETDMGIYVNGSAALRFDKKTHQASVAPSTYRFRIMDDAGMQYVEIVLGGMPQESKAVSFQTFGQEDAGCRAAEAGRRTAVAVERCDAHGDDPAVVRTVIGA